MESRCCMNVLCGTSTSIRWRKGWLLRSGEFADLCDKCGSAYDQSAFCDIFHAKDSGWRECTSCGKRLHCGCVASKSQLEILDTGGVSCITCTSNSGLQPITGNEKPNESETAKVKHVSMQQYISLANQLNARGMQVGNYTENDGLRCWLKPRNVDMDGPSTEIKPEVLPSVAEFGSTLVSQFHRESNGSSRTPKGENYKAGDMQDIYESLAQTNLSMTLAAPLENSNPFHNVLVDEREQSKMSPPLLLASRSRHLLPKPPRPTLSSGLEANGGMVSQVRIARPPAEGRGRNQLLPRYWPRITDQELQQISGDSNSTIVPLFEKMLSASDAGRIGRLVLPKACAEAYFPPISQPEGLPLRIQDVKGKEWMFQFRFWPNNNSRMYVLEGVTPCIQSMQLQAGDTVTFSRMDPEGKLIMGFRKATNSASVQETFPSNKPNGSHSSETSYSGVYENLPILSGYSGLLQSQKGCSETHLNVLSKKWNSVGGDMDWHNVEMPESRKRDALSLPPVLVPEKKRTRNIGSKSKRLLIDSQDALELKLTWEEAQDLLRPPPEVKPSVVMIEDHLFEEYEEPPVFGKKSIFVVRSNGINEQWTQCDSCLKWRKLPVDVLIPPKWTCMENFWDQSRCSCAAPNELNPRELDNLLRMNKGEEAKAGKFKMSKMSIHLFGVLWLCCWLMLPGEAQIVDDLKYKDPNQPISVRVKDLLSRMTLEEKIGQMTQIDRSVANANVMKTSFIGSVLSGGGSEPLPKASAEDWVNMINEFQKGALSSRLAIPMIYGIDAVHGHNNVYKSTIFPHNVGLGCARDADLVRRIGAATALEVRATGIPYTFAPCIAVCRDPRWGRCYESYSEDPKIVREMTEIIPGLQGELPPHARKGYPYVGGKTKVAACAKHFVGDGGTTKGVNENNTVIDWHGLENLHVPAYIDSINKGVATVMVSYSSWNGVKMHANRDLVTGFLKNTLKFKGFVISDWQGIDKITTPLGANYTYSVQASIEAGVDMVMVPFKFDDFIQDLTLLVKSNVIPMDRIDDAVERILLVKFTMGLFENPLADNSLVNELGSQAHRDLAREAVRKSLVLLKNGKNQNSPLLPLPKKVPKLLVAGTHADNLGYQCGGWTIKWQGFVGNTDTSGTTILSAINSTVDPSTQVVFRENPDADFLKSNKFDFAIVVVGEPPYAESAGDSLELTMLDPGPSIITNVCGAVKCVVVTITGRPIVIEPYLSSIDALVAAWLPGTEGQGVADVLFGDYGFSGKLARTWFKSVDQLPMNVGDPHYDPLFPFGFGLTSESVRDLVTRSTSASEFVRVCIFTIMATLLTSLYLIG